MNKKPLIILTGPTAVGKTALSIQLAKAINGEIISADSMQVYRYMDIGTAKIKKDQMQGIKHYLIDEFFPDEVFNVYQFQAYAKRYIKEIYKKDKIPILTGGTGFYIQAVLYDVCFDENETDYEYRRKLEEICRIKGPMVLHEMLRQVDPVSAEKIHENNIKRTIRALEYYKQNHEPISIHNERELQRTSPYHYLYFVLNDERQVLYDRINQRVNQMAEEGLVEEVKKLYEMGYSKELVSMQGIGYKETADYLDGEYSLEEMTERIKKNTRHFAKRQLTWFAREREVIWVNRPAFHGDEGKMLEYIKECIKHKWKEDET